MKPPKIKRYLKAFALLTVFFLCTGWTPFYYEGTYKGKVIDEATGEPIEGAVALATWSKCYPSPAGEMCDYYDAQDAVANEKGEFEIAGQGIRVFTFLEKMDLGVFKIGFRGTGTGSPDWGGHKDNGREVIVLEKLTLEQRKKIGSPSWVPSKAPFEKVKHFLKEVDKERMAQGYTPLRKWKVKEIEYI